MNSPSRHLFLLALLPSGRAQHPRRSPQPVSLRRKRFHQRDMSDRPRAVYVPPTLPQSFPRPGFPSISPSGSEGYTVRISRYIWRKCIAIHCSDIAWSKTSQFIDDVYCDPSFNPRQVGTSDVTTSDVRPVRRHVRRAVRLDSKRDEVLFDMF